MTTNKTTAIYLTLATALLLGSTPVLAQVGNTAYGEKTLNHNTGDYNSAFGGYALNENESGSRNTASGSSSLLNNLTGYDNTASGANSLLSNTTGSSNTASGSSSLSNNTTGNYNTASGYGSLSGNTEGFQNTASGNASLGSNTTGYNNTASGNRALYSNTTGIRNTGLGYAAGYSNQTGNSNVFLGRDAGYSETGSNKLYIANNATTPLLYGVFSATAGNNKLGVGTTTVAAGDAIAVWNGAHLTKGGVWANASSRDLKDHIQPLSTEAAKATLAALSPVRFVYKNSAAEEYMGFIAEDVPDLVAMNDHKSLSTMDIVAVLTTVTKEQQADITAQKARLAAKDGEIADLRAALAQQDAAMQKQDGRMLRLERALADLQRH